MFYTRNAKCKKAKSEISLGSLFLPYFWVYLIISVCAKDSLPTTTRA